MYSISNTPHQEWSHTIVGNLATKVINNDFCRYFAACKNSSHLIQCFKRKSVLPVNVFRLISNDIFSAWWLTDTKTIVTVYLVFSNWPEVDFFMVFSFFCCWFFTTNSTLLWPPYCNFGKIVFMSPKLALFLLILCSFWLSHIVWPPDIRGDVHSHLCH